MVEETISAFIQAKEDPVSLYEIKSTISSADKAVCSRILNVLKGVLKSKAKPFAQKCQALSVLKAGFDTLNMDFINETSLVLLSRLRSIAQRTGLRTGPPDAQEFYQKLAWLLQNWAMLFGEVAEESTLFSQVYYHLLSNGVSFPPYEHESGHIYLKEVIDLKGALSRNNLGLAHQVHSRLKTSKVALDEEITQLAGNGYDITRLLDINEKILAAFEEFETQLLQPAETPNTAKPLFDLDLSQTEEPADLSVKDHPQTLCESMEFDGEEPLDMARSTNLDWDQAAMYEDLSIFDELKALKDTHEDTLNELEKSQTRHARLRDKYEAAKAQVDQLIDSYEQKLNHRQQRHQTKVAHLNEKYQDLAEEFGDLEGKYKSVQEKSKSEQRDLQAQVKALEQERDEVRLKKEEATREWNKLEVKCSELESSGHTQQLELVRQLEEVRENYQKLARKHDSVANQYTELEKQLAAKDDKQQKSSAKLEESSTKLEQLTVKVEKLTAKVEKLTEQRNELSEERDELTTKNRKLAKKNKELAGKIEELSAQPIQHVSEQQVKDQQAKDQQAKEQQMKEQQMKEQQVKDQLRIRELEGIIANLSQSASSQNVQKAPKRKEEVPLLNDTIEYANVEFWAKALAKETSVLYEDDVVQIGCKLVAQPHFCLVNIYIGNKSPDCLQGVSLSLGPPEPGCNVKLKGLEDSQLAQGQTLNALLAVQFTEDFLCCPHVCLNYLEESCLLVLPVTPVFFCAPGRLKTDTYSDKFTVPVKGALLASDLEAALNFYGRFDAEDFRENGVLLTTEQVRIKAVVSVQKVLVQVKTGSALLKELVKSLVQFSVCSLFV